MRGVVGGVLLRDCPRTQGRDGGVDVESRTSRSGRGCLRRGRPGPRPARGAARTASQARSLLARRQVGLLDDRAEQAVGVAERALEADPRADGAGLVVERDGQVAERERRDLERGVEALPLGVDGLDDPGQLLDVGDQRLAVVADERLDGADRAGDGVQGALELDPLADQRRRHAGQVAHERAHQAVVLPEHLGELGQLGDGGEQVLAALAEGLAGGREVAEHLVAELALAVRAPSRTPGAGGRGCRPC